MMSASGVQKVATEFAGHYKSWEFNDSNVLFDFTATYCTNELDRYERLKIVIQYYILPSKSNEKNELADLFIASKSRNIILVTDLKSLTELIRQEIWSEIEDDTSFGSGWVFQHIKCQISYCKKESFKRCIKDGKSCLPFVCSGSRKGTIITSPFPF
ncbi:hypothetical protein CHS0354_001860 [Potamilus streckersoni]|uniref:Uncharacterized protein n=1 Tax=Potamilus streckersoni TaxID=2493646 RepID=A0AAE0S712_9BIVA|nr:hypothetical protein CHS0354_001860 [Potamilus streckersoni]